jgi:ribosomal protein S4
MRFFKKINLSIGFNRKSNHVWTFFTYSPFKFYKNSFFKNHVLFVENNVNLTSSKEDLLINYVFLKKRSGFFKKKNNMRKYILYRSNFFKKKKNLSFLNVKKKHFFKKESTFNIINTLRTVYHNRTVLGSFFSFKNTRQYRKTKYFSKFLKLSTKKFLLSAEFLLNNILIRCKFTITIKESNFLIKNNFVYVNNICINNPNYICNHNDLINICFFKSVFYFFKFNYNNKLKSTFSLGYCIWRINRLKGDFYKQPYNSIPSWVDNLIYFYNDIPDFLEVDYLTLSCFILKKINTFNQYNYFLFRSLNLYALRLYNWKYVV